jgi:hypothetical protein
MVDYKFYTDTFHGGSISAEDWPTFEARGADQLSRYKRIYTVTVPDDDMDAESKAICAMADALAYFTAALNGAGGQVSSASIGSVSVAYGGNSGGSVDLSSKGQAKELYRCACLYLDIYRGVG